MPPGWKVEVLQTMFECIFSFTFNYCIWHYALSMLGYGCGKNEYLYSFVLLVIVRTLYPCLLLVLVSAGISSSLVGTLAISFIILYSIVNLMSFFDSVGFSSQVHVSFVLYCYISSNLIWQFLLLFFAIFQDLIFLLFDMDPMQHLHILIVMSFWIKQCVAWLPMAAGHDGQYIWAISVIPSWAVEWKKYLAKAQVICI